MPRSYGAHSCRYPTSAPSRCWTKDPQGRRFAGIGPSGDEQPVDFGNKQRGSRPGYRRNVRRAAVCVPLRLEYIQVSVAAAEVNALALRIEEEIVGVAARVDHGNGAAVPQGEHTEPSGIAKCHQHSPGSLVQRHRKEAAVLDGPARCLLSGEAVDDRDLARLRDVHEDAAVRAGELKALGMGMQWDVGDLAVRRRVDDRECAIAVADEHVTGHRIDANIVGVIAQIESSHWLVVLASEQQHRTVTGIGDKNRVARRYIADTLRFLQSSNDVPYLARIQIDDRDAVVAELGNEEALPGQIDREVIDAAGDLAERNLGFELQR